jgi:hypothetical protein
MKISILHIGKTAGTALFAAIRKANSDNKIILHGHAFSINTVWKKFPQRNVIFGVREPLARYVSSFNSRLREGLPRHHTPWTKSEKVAFSLFPTPNALAEALSSPNAMEKAAAELSMLGIKHVSKPLASYLGSVDYLRKHKEKIKFVYLTETFNQDFEIMKTMLALGEVSLPTDDVGAHRMPDEMDTSLSDKARENLASWYEKDMEIYDYCKSMHEQFVEALNISRDASIGARMQTETAA